MSKEKSLDTTRIYNKKHNMPRCMIKFMDALELIKGVERIGVGPYQGIRSNESTLELGAYDELRGSYRVIIRHERFRQEFILGVNKNKRKGFERRLEEYLSN